MSEPLTALPVEHLCSVFFDTESTPMTALSNGPHGTRIVVNANDGTFTGARLSGTVVPPGGDWATLCTDMSLRIDVRSLWKTADGADILVTYTGVGWLEDGDYTLRTAPRFETGDERYAWLNRVQAVGIGQRSSDGVRYEIYAVS